jgi:hypothetical protein
MVQEKMKYEFFYDVVTLFHIEVIDNIIFNEKYFYCMNKKEKKYIYEE